MSKNCIITTVKSKIKGNATSYIEKENEIFIPTSKKFSLVQTRVIAQDKVNKINKEYLSEKFGAVVSLNTSYTDGTGIKIHPSQLLIDAYEVKEGNKSIEELNPRNLDYFNGDEALLEQEQREFNFDEKEFNFDRIKLVSYFIDKGYQNINENNFTRIFNDYQKFLFENPQFDIDDFIKLIENNEYSIQSDLNSFIDESKKIADEIKDVEQQVQEEKTIKPGVQGTLFQVKNIFNSIKELEEKLSPLNKTSNSIGSNKNLDDILKKAGIESNLRKEFIQLLEDNKSLKSLKLSEVLSSYLKEFIKESDRQYYKAIDEPLSQELENTLIQYFDKFHIRRKELDNLKEKFGVDSIGVFDVLAKTIYYSKNRNLLTLPEEYGHVFVELLGSIGNKKADNPLFKYMFDNIDSWDGYQRVYRDYKNIYLTAEGNTDIYKIKKEAIGQAIGIALVRNYKVQKGDKDFWGKIQEIIDYILNLIKGIDYVSLNTTVDNIAKDILNNNYSKLDRLKKDTSNYNLLSYSETIKNQNKIDGGKALKFMQWFSEKGMIITGSLAYRLQGNVYRPEIDALHDIDNIVPSDVHGLNLLKENFLTPEQLEQDKIYRKLITEGNYKEAKKYKIQGNLKLNLEEQVDKIQILQDFKKEFPDTEFLYSFYNQKANAYYVTINAIWSENQELKDRFKSYSGSFNSRLENFTKEELEQIYLFDFFLRPETTDHYKKIEDKEYGLSLAHFNYSFYEKLNMMGRPKDAFDYQMWDYNDENNILAPDFNDRLVYFQIDQSKKENTSTDQIKPGVAELFESKRSFADYSDFGKTLSEQEIINLKEEGNKVTAKQFLESITPVNDFEKKLKSFLLSIDLNKLNNFDFVINNKYQGNIIGLNERELFEKPTVIFNSKATNQPSRYKLHEFLHSLLDTVINQEQEFRTELISLYDYVKTLPEFKNEYGVIGWWEFYTEGMTNPYFQAKLKNVTLSGYKGGKKSSVYKEFIKIINSLLEKLGFVNKDYSALDEIINATTKVIEKRYGYGIKPGVQELFESNSEFAAIGTPEQYSQYLESLNKPNTNPILQGNQTNIEEIITQLEKEGLLEIDCKGKLKAEKGLATSFTKGGTWKVIKDLKGYPTHKEGGVDLTIGKDGVIIKNGNTQFTAKHGLVIPKAQNGLTIPSWMNPKNWGVNDYTDKGDFNTAYSTARKAGEKEFLFNGKRYNTDYKGTPQQQLKETGLTNEQIQNRSKINKNLTENIYPYSYNNLEKRIWTAGVLGKKEENREAIDKAPKPYDKEKLDALNLYAGVPQKNNTFRISNYKPSTSKDNINYYTFNKQDDKFVQNLVDYAYLKSKGSTDGSAKGYDIGVKGIVADQEKNVMGNYTMSTGKDDRGTYVSFYDKWDLAPMDFGKPFEIYDRIYTKDYGDSRQKRMYYTDKELSELNIDKKDFDILGLQRELSNRGYKLPKSTKQDGSFDGIWGDETKNALLEYRKSQNKTKH